MNEVYGFYNEGAVVTLMITLTIVITRTLMVMLVFFCALVWPPHQPIDGRPLNSPPSVLSKYDSAVFDLFQGVFELLGLAVNIQSRFLC